jgi:organic hydroperoxide reductase OsmC/OhrA
MKQHIYQLQLDWTGNDGPGTKTYTSYRRDHTVRAPNKPDIPCSSDPHFRGDPTRYNPEELLVASLSSCHMLWYLHLCAVNAVSVVQYHDSPTGVMEEADDGSGEFVQVTLRPTVEIATGGDKARAMALHEDAHRFCFIARSVKFPIKVAAEIKETAEAASGYS